MGGYQNRKSSCVAPPEAFYYRGHTNEGPYVIFHVCLFDSNTWLWRPINKMDDLTFRGMVESVVSLEDGSYQKEIEESDAVYMFLINLEKGIRPIKD